MPDRRGGSLRQVGGGLVSQGITLDRQLTVREALVLHAELFGLKDWGAASARWRPRPSGSACRTS